MTKLKNASEKVARIIDLLKISGSLLIDAQIVETVPDRFTNTPQISVNFSGIDAPLLLLNNGELLEAIQDIANASLQLDEDQHYLLWFDVNHFKGDRRTALQRLADSAVSLVLETAKLYIFPPMRSSERRELRLALLSSGLKSATTRHGFKRCVVLYPKGVTPPVEQPLSPSRPATPGQITAA